MDAPRFTCWWLDETAASPNRWPFFRSTPPAVHLMVIVVAALCATVVLTVAHAPALAAADLWVPNQPLVEGKHVFEDKGCQRCHGNPGNPTDARIGPDLGREQTWQDFMQLTASLWNHTPAMRARMQDPQKERPTLSPDEMTKLGAYLFSLNFLDAPGDVSRGRELFARDSCARCHQLGGQGGTIGPRLDELQGYATAIFLGQALWNHGPEMAAKMAELHLDRPRFESHDVADMVAFIRGAPQTDTAVELGSPAAGKALFGDKGCSTCHAIGGAGGSIGPDLASRRAARRVSETLAALWNHGPPMWAKMKDLGIRFPRLSDRDMADLLAYLSFVQYLGEDGDAAKGSVIFRDKLCAQCHTAGDGAKVGPDLAASAATRSPADWASAMWNHAPAMADRLRDLQLVWPQFEDDEMRDLVAFIRSRGANK